MTSNTQMNYIRQMKSIQQMIKELIANGMSEKNIANQLGSTQPTVHRMKHGAETSYSNGKALEKIYSERRTERAN